VATLSVKNNFLWWVVNHCPLFLYLAVLFFIHPILLLSKFQNWWIIRLPGTELYLKNIHSICILQTTAIRHHPRHHHQSQTPRLDWSNLLCLRFVITFLSGFTASNPVVSAPPIIDASSITLRLLLWCSVIVNPPHSNYSSRSGSSVPRPHTLSLCFLLSTIIPSVILCSRTHCAALFVLDMHVFAGEPIKNS